MTAGATRLVIAPDGMAWEDGHDQWAGEWADLSEVGDRSTGVRLPVPDDYDGSLSVVAVSAAEPAGLADVMALAAEVVQLREQVAHLQTVLQAVGTVITSAAAGSSSEAAETATSTRSVEPIDGETCSCGTPAAVVYETEKFGRVPYCGVQHPAPNAEGKP